MRAGILAIVALLAGCALRQPVAITRWPGVSDGDWAACEADGAAAEQTAPTASARAEAAFAAALAAMPFAAFAPPVLIAVATAALPRPSDPAVAANWRHHDVLRACLQHRGYRE